MQTRERRNVRLDRPRTRRLLAGSLRQSRSRAPGRDRAGEQAAAFDSGRGSPSDPAKEAETKEGGVMISSKCGD
jgi:hypothetical protein